MSLRTRSPARQCPGTSPLSPWPALRAVCGAHSRTSPESPVRDEVNLGARGVAPVPVARERPVAGLVHGQRGGVLDENALEDALVQPGDDLPRPGADDVVKGAHEKGGGRVVKALVHGLAAHGEGLVAAEAGGDVVQRVVSLEHGLDEGEEEPVGAEALRFTDNKPGFPCHGVEFLDAWERACCG